MDECRARVHALLLREINSSLRRHRISRKPCRLKRLLLTVLNRIKRTAAFLVRGTGLFFFTISIFTRVWGVVVHGLLCRRNTNDRECVVSRCVRAHREGILSADVTLRKRLLLDVDALGISRVLERRRRDPRS